MAGLFTKRILRGKAHQIFLVQGIDHTGRKAWYYLYVPQHHERAFSEICTSTMPFSLSHYGNILESGYGEEPPADIAAQIHSEYAG